MRLSLFLFLSCLALNLSAQTGPTHGTHPTEEQLWGTYAPKDPHSGKPIRLVQHDKFKHLMFDLSEAEKNIMKNDGCVHPYPPITWLGYDAQTGTLRYAINERTETLHFRFERDGILVLRDGKPYGFKAAADAKPARKGKGSKKGR
jgi:hypothetical protein